ncbi:conserved hypothetical protein [Cupriavidus neocaledonicus]|uniref:Uncharacterized protein n=1 Tax=Cupriavidus neocaledonicus TaxID=1040979 RepID=A0ABY1V0I7_9BURK|nr:conserved hypothetical protein [Cupriavidus neocaledonicus]
MRNCIMGNNHLASECHLRGNSLNEPPVPGANGILARIPGQFVSAAVSLLPPAALTQELHQEVEMDAGPAGRVRFFVKRMRARHHRHSYYFRCTGRSR